MELAALALTQVAATAPGAGPFLLNRDPAPGESDVPIGVPLALQIGAPAGAAIDGWSVRVYVNGALACDGSAPTPIAAAYAAAGSGYAPAATLVRVVLAPAQPLPAAAAIAVRVVASTGGGASRFDATYSFTVEDVDPPRLLAAMVTGAASIRLAFTKAPASAAGVTIALSPRAVPAVPGAIVSTSVTDTFLDLTLEEPLTPAVDYQVTVSGVADARGHALGAPGDTTSFTAFRPPRPDGRSFDLWSMLPKLNRRQDTSGELAKFVACLQEVTDWLLAELDALADLVDLERAPEWMVDRILADLGNPFALPLLPLEKRRLAEMLIAIYQQKGTAPGLKDAIRFFVGLDDVEITPLTATTLVLGESALGVDWDLGPSTRFARYAFEIAVPRALTDDERTAIQTLTKGAKPAHTHLTAIVEPAPPPIIDHWELGMSELGTQSILH